MPRRYLSISIISITRYYVIHIYQDIHSLILGGVIYYHSPGFTPMYPQSYMVHCSRHLYNCWWGLSLTGHAVCRYINMDSIMATKNVVFNSRCPYSCCVFQSLQVKAVSICISFFRVHWLWPHVLKVLFFVWVQCFHVPTVLHSVSTFVRSSCVCFSYVINKV